MPWVPRYHVKILVQTQNANKQIAGSIGVGRKFAQAA